MGHACKASIKREHVLGKIEEWIHQVNASHESAHQSCSTFQREFEGFYSLGKV